MKSNVLILKAVLLLLGGNLVACDDSKEPEVVGTPPVAASEEVTAFFTTHLPESSYNCSEVKFNFSEIDFGETECFLINSTEEFEAVRRLRLSCRSSTSKNTRSSSDNICWATPDTLSRSRLSIPTPNPVK